MKKMISLVVTLALMLSLTVPAMAVSDSTNTDTISVDVIEEEIDAALKERGYPQDILDCMAPSAKESLYNKPDVVYSSGSVHRYNMNDSDGTLSPTSIAPYGQIPVSDLILVWSAGINSDGDVLLQYSYVWEELPFNRYQDPISVSWDGEIFRHKTNSFYKEDSYGVYDPATGKTIRKSYGEHGYAKGNDNGVTWYAALEDVAQNGVISELYGYGEMLLELKTTDHGSTVFYGHYVHNLTTYAISINIATYGSIEVSGGSSYDERGNQHTFRY